MKLSTPLSCLPNLAFPLSLSFKVLLEKLSLQDGNGEVKSYLAEGWVFRECLSNNKHLLDANVYH